MIWKLTDKLYWGDRDAPIDQYSTGSLICMAEELPVPTVKVPYLRIPLPNGQPIPMNAQTVALAAVMQFIEDYSPVTIYCKGGANRSAGIAFLYLIEACDMSKADAWLKIKSLKPNALDWSKDHTKIVEIGE